MTILDLKLMSKMRNKLKKLGKEIKPISIIDSGSLEGVKKILNTLIKEKTAIVE